MRSTLMHAAMIAAATVSLGASYRTQNFIVQAPAGDLAREMGLAAESYRRDLALEWFGRELPAWPTPCLVQVEIEERHPPRGETSFRLERQRPRDWRMRVAGKRDVLLNSVLPHEVMHTILGTYFSRPLPRWAEEGICTFVEHVNEREKQEQLLQRLSAEGGLIPLQRLLHIQEYPVDLKPLYLQGYSLATFLIGRGGPQKFVAFITEGIETRNWTQALNRHYGFRSVDELQSTWMKTANVTRARAVAHQE